MKHNKARPTDRQTGSALVVSLIMLSAVTFLAIISMESSSVQLKMVSNSQKSEQVFQAALSELEAQFSESNEYGDAEDTLYEAMTSFTTDEDGNFLSLPVDADQISTGYGTDLSTSVIYTGDPTTHINRTFNGDTSASKFQRRFFTFNTEADISERFNSDQSMGFSRLVPVL
ncbi:MAG TPA: hypothetical protein DEA26_00465 [Oceanospirillales bacterium]|nr:hypothetical protein [Oceanospirillaceae bacterium]HBS41120.1 hypothetical protein [Oceanospirillales bacterium]|tara:strand:+ start:4592 stop:5107 length:516 start_codon:yes stop_codon:yes gene_type:complete